MPKRSFAVIVAASILLVTFGAVTSFARDTMADGDATAPRSGDYEETLLAQSQSGLSDLVTLAQAGDSPTPQGQDRSSDQNGTAAQGSASEGQRQLRVNPLTGLVSDTEGSYTPLTGEERWKLYWKMNYFSVGAYFGPFFSALLLDQATGSPAEWGGGFAGYGRRVASRTASAILQGTFQAPVAYLLHEDVRYIASKQPGFKRRALHAIVYSFLTYNNSGRPTLNIANLGGYYASTAVSTVWLPGHYKVLSYTLSNSTEQIGLTLPVNILQEFWPEVVRTFHQH